MAAGAGHGEHPADLGKYWPDPGDEPFWRELVEAELGVAKPVTRALISFLGEADPLSFDKFVAASNFGLRTSRHVTSRHLTSRHTHHAHHTRCMVAATCQLFSKTATLPYTYHHAAPAL